MIFLWLLSCHELPKQLFAINKDLTNGDSISQVTSLISSIPNTRVIVILPLNPTINIKNQTSTETHILKSLSFKKPELETKENHRNQSKKIIIIYHFITNKQLNAQTDPQTPMGSEKGKIKSWGKRLNERATKPIPSNQIQWSKPWNSIPGRDSKCGWVIQRLFLSME